MENILRKLVAFQTVTGEEQATHEALDYIASYLAERGMHIERFDSHNFESLVALTQPGHKTPKVMLGAHLDVVSAPDELFTVRKENGRLYGRGVLDMKFSIAAYMQFVDDIQDHLEDYDFGIMITSDEEIGGYNGVAELIKEGYLPKVCILPDGGDNWQIQTGAKGFLRFKVTSYGKSAHGSRPWLGKSAFAPLLKALSEIEALFPENNAQSNTYNLGLLEGGTSGNQVADYAEALLDFRLINKQEMTRIHKATQATCAKYDLELSVQLEGGPVNFSLDEPYIAPFARHITDVTGITVEGSYTLGSSDARHFSDADVPCVSLYPTGGDHHGSEEWLSEEAFYQFKEVLDRYMDEVAKVSSGAPSLAAKH